MMSDPLPKEHVLAEDRVNEPQLVFEWAQWIVWASRVFENEPYLAKKNIGIGIHPEIVNLIFGQLTEIIVTIRPPAESYLSFRERFLPENSEDVSFDPWKLTVLQRCSVSEEHWSKLSTPDRYLLYWCAIYLELLNSSEQDRLTGLQFGSYYESFLKDFALDHGEQFQPESFAPSERENLPSFSPECERLKENVETQWQERFNIEPY
jgi:hypothetical protein